MHDGMVHTPSLPGRSWPSGFFGMLADLLAQAQAQAGAETFLNIP